ncbi:MULTISPECIES: cytochrome-c peroxidase [unclassified Rhizobium]|uniref:cytochrome-c peroxidase n=1 Tax=unclassified Rhizobium TaxID=2613769 RepID=UPI003D275216
MISSRTGIRVLAGLSVLAAGLCVAGMDFSGGLPSSHAALAEDQRDALFPLPPSPRLNAAKVELGETLFNDPILSRRQMLSCASCHGLATGGTVPVKRTVGYDGRLHQFNASTVFNVGNNYRLGWRGKFASLAAQNENVLIDPNLMANDWQTLLPRLTGTDFYRTRFKAIYGRSPDRDSVLDALVTFQRSLVTPNAPFDLYLEGNANAITPEQQRGYELFKSYGCVSCHQGSNIGGNMFQIFGIFAPPEPGNWAGPSADILPWPLSGADEDEHVFRVPSLRNVEVTAPYFHDGRAERLDDAVAIMGRSQLGRELPQDDVASIVEFLKSLTGEYNGERLKAPSIEGGR